MKPNGLLGQQMASPFMRYKIGTPASFAFQRPFIETGSRPGESRRPPAVPLPYVLMMYILVE